MQVVQAQGMFAKWKQPVYIAFDQQITTEILLLLVNCIIYLSYNVAP